MSMSHDEVRKEAERRVNAKQNFWRALAGFVIVFGICCAIWALSGKDGNHGYFWPIWPAFGMGIALAYSAVAAFGPGRGVTENQIDAEMKKIQGD